MSAGSTARKRSACCVVEVYETHPQLMTLLVDDTRVIGPKLTAGSHLVAMWRIPRERLKEVARG